MRDLGAASKLIATAQTAVARNRSLGADLADELYNGAPAPAPALSKQQAAVRASRENQRLRKQYVKRLQMMANPANMWMAPQPLIQRRRTEPQQQYMQQMVPQAVLLPPGVYLVSGAGPGAQPQAQPAPSGSTSSGS